MSQTPRIILGIDPGTLVMGYGIIKVTGKKIDLKEMGVLQLSRTQDHSKRLELIYRKMEALILAHKPTDVAIEAPFFGKNVQSMLKLGRAQGVAIAAAMMHGLRAEEYAPRKVKQSITGKGNATKEQVWQMLQHMLKFEDDSRFMDATDAVGVAICHNLQTGLAEQLGIPVSPAKKAAKSKSSWAAFADANPERVKGKPS